MRVATAAIGISFVLLSAHAREGAAERHPTPTWQSALSESLAATYSVCKVSRAAHLVEQPGTIVVLLKDGLKGGPYGNSVVDNFVLDGRVWQKSTSWLKALDAVDNRRYEVGERNYVSHIEVQSDEIRMSLVTLDTYDETWTRQGLFKADVHFRFAPGQLSTMPYAEVRRVIGAVLVREEDLPAGKGIVPGETRRQVDAVLGGPEIIITLGRKVVCVYAKLKVVFLDGKVSAIE